MYTRTLYLSSSKRIAEIKKRLDIDLPKTLLHQNLIHIHTPNASIRKQLLACQNENAAILSYFSPDQANVILQAIPGSQIPQNLTEVLPQLNRLNKNDPLETWSFRDKILDFNKKTILMGILNVTPDSFSDGGLFTSRDAAVAHVLQMEAEGAEIVDVGGESTRPGSDPVSAAEEIARVVPVIEAIRRQSSIVVSVDTTKSRVAEAALLAGADLVNDISALQLDPKMVDVVRAVDCPVVIMHMKGTPKNMQQNPSYGDVTAEIYSYFKERLSTLQQAGIRQIALDPGIGFGKRTQDNLHLLRDLKDFGSFNLPILIGLSRKSFIGNILDRPVDQRLSGTLGAHLYAVQQGASILRVHDVKETKDALKMYTTIAES